MCSGSEITIVTRARVASRPGSASGRSSTLVAPSRLSAATTVNTLGRVLITTPTRSPCRTPMLIRPLTTLSTRTFRSCWR